MQRMQRTNSYSSHTAYTSYGAILHTPPLASAYYRTRTPWVRAPAHLAEHLARATANDRMPAWIANAHIAGCSGSAEQPGQARKSSIDWIRKRDEERAAKMRRPGATSQSNCIRAVSRARSEVESSAA